MVQEQEKSRTPQERETLIFPTAEEAQEWLEDFGERLGQERGPVVRRRELLAEEIARQFDRAGEGVGMIIRPWEHTPDEHAEVQHLVDVAFARDLPVALKLARASEYYPRNIDLFHDILTTEMYELLRGYNLHRQPLSLGILLTTTIVIGVAAVILLFVVLA